MKNKVLIILKVPEIDNSFDIFIPVNEVIWKVKKVIIKSISDLCEKKLDINGKYILINEENGKIYSNNDIVINTDIRNASRLIMLLTI